MTRTPNDIFEQTRLAQRRYEELTRSSSGVLRAANGISATTSLAERVASNQNRILERAAMGRDMATRIAQFQVDQSINDILGPRSSLLGAASGLNAATAIAQRLVDHGPLQKTILELNAAINLAAERQRLSSASLYEAIERATSGYQSAYRIAERIGHELARQQEGIIAAISQMPTERAFAMAHMLEGLDVGEWDDIDELETGDSNVVQSRLIAAIIALLSRLHPREWGPGEYLAILFFIIDWNNPNFTQDDRQVLAETREFSQLAAEQANDAAEALKDIKQAEIARQQVIQYVSELPRAEIKAKGNVRELPSGSARRIAVLKEGTAIAVVERQERWLRIIYRDELSDNLAQGWLWGGSAILPDPSPKGK